MTCAVMVYCVDAGKHDRCLTASVVLIISHGPQLVLLVSLLHNNKLHHGLCKLTCVHGAACCLEYFVATSACKAGDQWTVHP